VSLHFKNQNWYFECGVVRACGVADTLAFSIPDVPESQIPQPCSLCKLKLASLNYQIDSNEPSFQQLSGSCCLGCGSNLVAGFDKVSRARRQGDPPEAPDSSAN
jgi:hypothetical protein